MLRFLKKQPVEVHEDIQLINRLEAVGATQSDLLEVSDALYRASKYSQVLRTARKRYDKRQQMSFDF